MAIYNKINAVNWKIIKQIKNKDDLYTAFGKLGVFFPNSVEEIILKIKNNV